MSTLKVSNIQDISNNAAMSISGGVVTFPNTPVNAGGGKVLQVLTATDSTERTTTSTSLVTASNTLAVTNTIIYIK